MKKTCFFVLVLALLIAALPPFALRAGAETEEPITSVTLDVASLTPGETYAPGNIVSAPADAVYSVYSSMWEGADGMNAIPLEANEPHVLRVIVKSPDALHPFASDAEIAVNGADSFQTDGKIRASSFMLLITVSAKENVITSVTLDVTPPAAGQTCPETRPTVTLADGQRCTVYSTSWLTALNMYTSEELPCTFEEGQTYYIYILLKAEDGVRFQKSGTYATGIDEGADFFSGCTVTGGTLAFAASRTISSEAFKGDYLYVKVAVTATAAQEEPPADPPASAVKPGDVDFDGEITAADARLALRRAVELETYAPGSDEFIACNVDKDAEVTAADARLILRAAVELEDPATW